MISRFKARLSRKRPHFSPSVPSHQSANRTKEKRESILAKIFERLETELADLDETGMALWHGRNQAANGTMIAALAAE